MTLKAAENSGSGPIVLVEEVEPTLLSRGYSVFLRLVALVFVVLTIQVWLAAVGYGDGSLRFDRMDRATRVYEAAMLVLLPVTAVGLWTTLSWGRVVWLLTVTVQTVIAWRFPHVFPQAVWWLPFHLATGLVFLASTFGLSITTKKP